MILAKKTMKKALCVLAAMTVMGGSIITLPSIVPETNLTVSAKEITKNVNSSYFKTAGNVKMDNYKVKQVLLYTKNRSSSDSATFSKKNFKIIKYSVSNNSIVKTSLGKKTKAYDGKYRYDNITFTAIKPGSTTVTVQYEDGSTHKCNIDVYSYIEQDITLTSDDKGNATTKLFDSGDGENSYIHKNGAIYNIRNEETFYGGGIRINTLNNDKKVSIMPKNLSKSKGTVYIEYETSIRVIHYNCEPIYSRKADINKTIVESNKYDKPISANVISGSSYLEIGGVNYKSNGENCVSIKTKNISGSGRVKVVWEATNGKRFNTYYDITVVDTNHYDVGSSHTDTINSTNIDVKHNCYNSSGQELGNGIGITAHCYKAFAEKWQYVWGGKTPGSVDCGGLIYTYCPGVYGYDMCADTRNAYPTAGKQWGYISNGVPRIHGLALHAPGHVGVYVGNGMEIDASCPSVGLVYGSVYARNWDIWYKLRGLSYPVKGFVRINNHIFYYENEQYVINCTKTINGVTYTFDSNGYCNKTVPNSEYNKTTWTVY